jgi:predicted alpha/beta hydrolase family esterase
MAHVTFVHGIANKPPAGLLLDLWLRGLAAGGGLDLPADGITSAMTYWADVFYERPIGGGMAQESLEVLEATGAEPVNLSWRESEGAAEHAWMAELEAKLQAALAATAVSPPDPDDAGDVGGVGAREMAESVLLPWFARERLLETLLRDAHHYLWNARVREKIRRRMVAALVPGAGQPRPHVVVAHGMGAVIAYDCLKQVEDCPEVDAFVTLGSPLGIEVIRKRLQPGWTRRNGFPSERLRGRWINVYDRLDPLTGFNPHCAHYFERGGLPVIDDVHDPSHGRWRHGIAKYLAGPRLRGRLAGLLGLPTPSP